MSVVLNPSATISAASFVKALRSAERLHRVTLAIPEDGLPFAAGFAVVRAPDGTLGLAVVASAPPDDPALYRTPKAGETWRTLPGVRSSDPDSWPSPPAATLVRIAQEEDNVGDIYVRAVDGRTDGWTLRAFLAPVEEA